MRNLSTLETLRIVQRTPAYKARRLARERAAFLSALRASLVPESARDVVFASHASSVPANRGLDEPLRLGPASAYSTQSKDSQSEGHSNA